MTELVAKSTPSFCEFDPTIIPYQEKVLEDIWENFDYSLGTHEVLLSGSVGSAKSILLAHLAIKHCLRFPRARLMIGRRALQDLRLTIWQKILEHLEGTFVQDKHYKVNLSQMTITFRNGSKIISRSWADGRYSKIRSLELSAAIIEELTENDDDDKQFYSEVKMRVGRLPHIKQNFIACATNPDAPSHWAYPYFIEAHESNHATKHVYYSVTTDNPFLPQQYIRQLLHDLDPKEALRMVHGQWVEIAGEVVYHSYNKDVNFVPQTYQINSKEPIHIAFDFNIGEGKPLSCALLQYEWPICNIFNESVIHSARTSDTLDDLEDRGLLSADYKYIISGDASGKNRDTRNKKSDYDIIKERFIRLGLQFEMRVPAANPPVRARHNTVNAMCLNALGQSRLKVWKDAPTADKGLRLTKLKKGANYIEDDSKEYQHITTAIGYDIMMEMKFRNHTPSRTIQL